MPHYSTGERYAPVCCFVCLLPFLEMFPLHLLDLRGSVMKFVTEVGSLSCWVAFSINTWFWKVRYLDVLETLSAFLYCETLHLSCSIRITRGWDFWPFLTVSLLVSRVELCRYKKFYNLIQPSKQMAFQYEHRTLTSTSPSWNSRSKVASNRLTLVLGIFISVHYPSARPLMRFLMPSPRCVLSQAIVACSKGNIFVISCLTETCPLSIR